MDLPPLHQQEDEVSKQEMVAGAPCRKWYVDFVIGEVILKEIVGSNGVLMRLIEATISQTEVTSSLAGAVICPTGEVIIPTEEITRPIEVVTNTTEVITRTIGAIISPTEVVTSLDRMVAMTGKGQTSNDAKSCLQCLVSTTINVRVS